MTIKIQILLVNINISKSIHLKVYNDNLKLLLNKHLWFWQDLVNLNGKRRLSLFCGVYLVFSSVYMIG